MSVIGAKKKPATEAPQAPAETLYRITRAGGGIRVEEVEAVVVAGSPPRLVGHDIFDIAIAKLHAAIRRRVGL